MILKEFQFGLDLTNIPKDLSIEKKHWQNIIDNIKQYGASNLFNMETRCICALFERLMSKYKTDSTWKIYIVCTQNKNLKIVKGEVYHIEINLDYFFYRKQEDKQKKIIILECIIKAIKKFLILEKKIDDIDIFNKVSKQIIDRKYVNEYFYKKKIQREDKRYSVALLCVHDLYSMDMYVILKDKKGFELDRQKIIHAPPSEWIFSDYFGKFQWTSDTEVRLFYKGGKNAACKAKVDFADIIQQYEKNQIES